MAVNRFIKKRQDLLIPAVGSCDSYGRDTVQGGSNRHTVQSKSGRAAVSGGGMSARNMVRAINGQRCWCFKIAVLLLAAGLITFGWPGWALAQNVSTGNNGNETTMSMSISVSATVMPTDPVVGMVTLRDMFFERLVTREGIIDINPVQDIQAGQMRAEGVPNAEVRISFLQEQTLTRTGGEEQLIFYYVISGNELDDQASSEILELDNRDFTLNADGEFYFWIGGQVDIRNAVQGSYDGEFTVEIEYLET